MRSMTMLYYAYPEKRGEVVWKTQQYYISLKPTF